MPVTYALLCPGQGGQHAGMLDRVRDEPAVAALNFNAGTDLFANAVAQPLIVACALAHGAALAARGLPRPAVLLGYSVGELSAAALAGCFRDAPTSLRLAAARAAAMDAAAGDGSGLLAVRGLSDEALDALARDAGLETAIYNGPGHRVLGGPAAALELA